MKNLKNTIVRTLSSIVTLVMMIVILSAAGCEKSDSIVGIESNNVLEKDTVGNFMIIMDYGGCDSIQCWGESYVVFSDNIYNISIDTNFATMGPYIKTPDSLIACSRIYIIYYTEEECFIDINGETIIMNGWGEYDLNCFYEVCYIIRYGRFTDFKQ